MAPDETKKPGEAEARAAALRILGVVFPLCAVLAREQPLSALTGLGDMSLSLGLMMVSMGNSLFSMTLSARITEAIYLRNVARFRTLIVVHLAQGFAENGLYCAREWAFSRYERKWRTRLTHHLHDRYFARAAFYRQRLLPDALADADERICQDVTRAIRSLSYMVDSLITGVMSAVWNAGQLAWRTHPVYVLICLVYCWGSIQIRNVLSPALAQGQLGGRVSEVTGRYFSSHQKLVQHREAIAAADGGAREKAQIQSCFTEFLTRWRSMCALSVRSSAAMRLDYSLFMSTFMNALTHGPFLRSKQHPLRVGTGATETERLEANAAVLSHMVFQQRLIMRCISNIGELFRMNRSLMMSSGTTIRIAELMQQLDEVEQLADLPDSDSAEQTDSTPGLMQLAGVNIDSPAGGRLLTDLTLTFPAGENLLVCGDNGRGKTSIFRTLKGLWPVAAGRVVYRDASPSSCLYLPQTPYVVRNGSLQDQLTFPLQLAGGSVTPEQLGELLALVGLEDIAQKIGGEGEKLNWDTLLSFSEKQKMAVARVYFHRPAVAIIDEATSGLGLRFDRENLFEPCRAKGITLVFVAQQRSMLQFCDKVLSLSGAGEWDLTAVNDVEKSPLMRTLTIEVNADDGQRDELSAARELRQQQEEQRSVQYQHLKEKKRTEALPPVSTFSRLKMVLRVLFPQVSLGDYAVQRLIQTFVFMAVSIYTSSRVMSELPGQLQALAIQNDMTGYVKLTFVGTGFRCLSMSMDLWLTWLNNTLSLHWQEALTRHVMDHYCERNAYSQVVGAGLTDADTRITREIIDACERFAGLMKGGMSSWGGSMQMGSGNNYGRGIIRPICDACFMSVLLIRVRLPTIALLTIAGYSTGGLLLIKMLAPNFGSFQAETERTQGEFRSAHAKVKSGAELIALAGAGEAEKGLLNEKLAAVLKVERRLQNTMMRWNPIEWVMTWSVPQSITYSLRLLWSLGAGTNSEVMANADGTGLSSTGQYIESLIERAFRTFGSLLELHTELGRLMGVVRRVTDLMLAVEQARESNVDSAENGRVKIVDGDDAEGVLISADAIDITTPDGRCLAAGLCFTVRPGEHMLIAGSSAAGKTVLFRHLARLWPVLGGHLFLPKAGISFVSQTPLVPTIAASLADMVSYPLTGAQADAAARELVVEMLKLCHMGAVLEREGLEVTKRWEEVLSSGEQQCLAVARALYHRPRVVVFDEGFSAVSSELRLLLLQTLADRGVTVLCIAQGDDGASQEEAFFHSRLELGVSSELGWRLELLTAKTEPVAKQLVLDGAKSDGSTGLVEPVAKQLVIDGVDVAG